MRFIFTLICSLFISGIFGQRSIVIKEDTVSLSIPEGKVKGTLLYPVSKQKVPLVIFISGSGATDRNGNGPGFQNNSLKMLADSLAQAGIATLRYDKRGVGESNNTLSDEREISIDKYIKDATAWFALFQADKRFSSTSFLGHSEGSLIGMVAARQAGAAKFISVAGSGLRASVLLKKQLANLPGTLKEEAFISLDSLAEGHLLQHATPPSLGALLRPSVQPYLISWFAYDPAAEIAKLTIPVLVIQGSNDLQVGTDQADLLAASVHQKAVIIDKMNHVLKAVETREQNQQAYNNPTLPLIPAFVQNIIRFVKQ